jgi:nucleoside-diphosphate-sugar epimerase
MARILVTGANGFVGSNLCCKLVARGDSVRGLVRQSSDLALLDGIPIERIVGDLGDPSSLTRATRDVELVYHVAGAVTDWGTLSYFRRINVYGTRNVLEAAVQNRVSRLVYVSSTAVHGFGARDMNEESPLPPTRFPYVLSKREAEALVREAHRKNRIETTIVRPGDLYGPGDRVVLLPLAALLESGWMALIAQGKHLGAFTYVENLADALILAGTVEQAAGGIYVITDGIELTWRAYFCRLTAALDLPAPKLSLNPWLALALAQALERAYQWFGGRRRPPITRYLVAHLSKDYHFSIAKARRELGYRPQIKTEEAIRRTAAWYRQAVRGERLND